MNGNLIYGPVPSRRLGLSLGVDLVPYKTCSYNCVYCQIGPTPKTTTKRRPYTSSEKILSQVYECLDHGVLPDYITLGGSGEPTLHSEINTIIDRIKQKTDIPVAVLTNGSLLFQQAVREAICRADVVLPSLDAAEGRAFRRINRPHPDVTFEKMTRGLVEFRNIYAGKIWLEIFLAEGINNDADSIQGFARWIDAIRPDRVHLNTAVRPTAESFVRPLPQERLERVCHILGDKAEVIASFKAADHRKADKDIREKLLNILARRPCTLADMADGLGVHRNEILKYLEPMAREQEIEVVEISGQVYYQKTISPADGTQEG